MENKIIEMIYDKIKDMNFYNYDNDEKLKDVEVKLYMNTLMDYVIDIKLPHKIYTIECIETYADKESKEQDNDDLIPLF